MPIMDVAASEVAAQGSPASLRMIIALWLTRILRLFTAAIFWSAVIYGVLMIMALAAHIVEPINGLIDRFW